MKIIHCADVHLGASMRTHLSLEQANQRKDELLKTFSDMINYAQNNEIANILIAGDLLDSSYADKRTRNVLIDLISSHSAIDFYYLCGNHDENNLLLSSEDLPKNLHTFNREWTSYNLNGAILTGAILGENNEQLYRSLDLDPQEFNIVMLHGGEAYGNDFSTPDTVNFDALTDKNIDYLALGHIHTFTTGKLDKRCTYAYSGCLEGRGFDECGKKGFIVLDLNPDGMKLEFVPFGKRELHELTVDISDCQTSQEITQKVQDAIAPIPSKDIVRIIFVGEYDENTQKYLNLVTMDAQNKFFFFTYKDKTVPKIDLSVFENDISLAGEFVRTVKASDLSDERKQKVILLGLKALNGEEVD